MDDRNTIDPRKRRDRAGQIIDMIDKALHEYERYERAEKARVRLPDVPLSEAA